MNQPPLRLSTTFKLAGIIGSLFGPALFVGGIMTFMLAGFATHAWTEGAAYGDFWKAVGSYPWFIQDLWPTFGSFWNTVLLSSVSIILGLGGSYLTFRDIKSRKYLRGVGKLVLSVLVVVLMVSMIAPSVVLAASPVSGAAGTSNDTGYGTSCSASFCIFTNTISGVQYYYAMIGLGYAVPSTGCALTTGCSIGTIAYGGPGNAGGATGTNATTVLQNSISAIKASDDYGIADFQPAVYSLSGRLVIYSGVTLRCVTPEQSIACYLENKKTGMTTAFITFQNSPSSGGPAYKPEIDGLQIDVNNLAEDGININNQVGLVLMNVAVTNANNGIIGTDGSTFSEYGQLLISDVNGSGLYLGSGGITYGEFVYVLSSGKYCALANYAMLVLTELSCDQTNNKFSVASAGGKVTANYPALELSNAQPVDIGLFEVSDLGASVLSCDGCKRVHIGQIDVSNNGYGANGQTFGTDYAGVLGFSGGISDEVFDVSIEQISIDTAAQHFASDAPAPMVFNYGLMVFSEATAGQITGVRIGSLDGNGSQYLPSPIFSMLVGGVQGATNGEVLIQHMDPRILPAKSSQTIGASPYTLTNNQPYAEIVMLTTVGGLSMLTYKGTVASTAAGIPYQLFPGESMVFTWSGTTPVVEIFPTDS